MLQWIPQRVAGLVFRDEGDLVQALHPVSGHYSRAIWGTRRPSSSRRAFQSATLGSSSRSSWPGSSSRTGCAESSVTRYWYQERSQAIVITTSGLTPDSGTTLALGSPRLLAIPAIVRRNALALNRSAASTIASS